VIARRLPAWLALGLVLAVVLAACAQQPQIIEVRPECTPPPQPALPAVSGDELAALPDDVYWRLEDRERRLADWSLEMQAMLEALCGAAE
jgi:hypothetical protein